MKLMTRRDQGSVFLWQGSHRRRSAAFASVGIPPSLDVKIGPLFACCHVTLGMEGEGGGVVVDSKTLKRFTEERES